MEWSSDQDVGFDYMCRICAKVRKDLVSLFHTKRKEKTMADMLIYLQVNVQQNDGWPQNICTSCVPKLMKTFEFLDTIKSSEEYFQNMLLTANVRLNRPTAATGQPLATGEPLVTTVFDENVEDPLASVLIKSEHMDVTETKVKAEETNQNEIIVCVENKVIPIHEANIQEPAINIPIVPSIPPKVKRKRAKNPPPISVEYIKHFECYICKKTTSTLNRLSTHILTHNAAAKPFKCFVCSEAYVLRYELNRHLCRGDSITCEYCGEVFHSTVAIMDHVQIHKDNLLYYKCLRCIKKFHLKELNTWHDLEHERFQFACKCGKRFATKRLLTNHEKRHLDARCK